MSKKIVIFLLCLFPVAMMAQEAKLGHINSNEILMAMPEREVLEKTLDDLQSEYESEILKMREEYFAKLKEYQDKLATMPQSIKQARETELMEMEQRITTFNQTASSDLQQKQQEMLAPIVEKIRKAISEVGAEHNYTYIFDLAQPSIVYQSAKSNDITAQVKSKLGLK